MYVAVSRALPPKNSTREMARYEAQQHLQLCDMSGIEAFLTAA